MSDAWTLFEFAQLCCGWNPKEHQFPDREMYDEARDSITRAVRVKVLPTIDDLAWPGTSAELMYDAIPAFRPRDVANWAVKRYSDRFPYSTDDWSSEQLDARERTTLLAIIGVLARLAKLSLEQPTKAAGVIVHEAKTDGVKLNTKTVGTHLKKIADALDRRTPER